MNDYKQYRPSIPRKEHDAVLAELERVKQENEHLSSSTEVFLQQASDLRKDNMKLEYEIKQLNETLKKCDPYERVDGVGDIACQFCGEYHDKPHQKDCQYIRLCGGGTNEL